YAQNWDVVALNTQQQQQQQHSHCPRHRQMGAPHWRHATVVIHTDNTTAEAASPRATHGVGPAITSIRSALLQCATLDIQLHCARVTSADNGLADALSRLDWPTIANLCPHWQMTL
ncbi:hypothetical protein E4U58_000354, partial [Claviceps cyperi]